MSLKNDNKDPASVDVEGCEIQVGKLLKESNCKLYGINISEADLGLLQHPR